MLLMTVLRALPVVFLAALAAAPDALAQTGQQKYTQWCQGCHNFPGNNRNNVLGGKDWNVIKLAMDTKAPMTSDLRPPYDDGVLTDEDFMLIADYLQTFPGGLTRQLAMPADVDFGAVAVGAGSATVTREITSVGNAAVQLAATVSSSNPAEFGIASTTCTVGAFVLSGATCSVTLQFTPAATGTRSGQVDVVSNSFGSPESFAVSGTGTSAQAAIPVPVVEYFNAGFGHYFMTADADEIAGLDAGAFGGAFVRTGRQFTGWNAPGADTLPVCRFFTRDTSRRRARTSTRPTRSSAKA